MFVDKRGYNQKPVIYAYDEFMLDVGQKRNQQRAAEGLKVPKYMQDSVEVLEQSLHHMRTNEFLPSLEHEYQPIMKVKCIHCGQEMHPVFSRDFYRSMKGMLPRGYRVTGWTLRCRLPCEGAYMHMSWGRTKREAVKDYIRQMPDDMKREAMWWVEDWPEKPAAGATAMPLAQEPATAGTETAVEGTETAVEGVSAPVQNLRASPSSSPEKGKGKQNLLIRFVTGIVEKMIHRLRLKY